MNLLSSRMGVGAQLDKAGLPGLDIAFLGRPDTALLTTPSSTTGISGAS